MRRCIPFVSRPENCYVVDYFRLCDTELFEFRRTRAEKEELMSRRLNLELELPYDVVAGLQDEDLTSKAKEALVMELLREHRVSQGKAAAILGLNRADLFPLMTRYKVAVIDLTDAELREELNRPLPTD